MKVSIVIAAYNSERFVGRAIRSCVEQSMPKGDYEVIVVNDGSEDNTAHVLEPFGEWIKVITLNQNMGLAYAVNMGIKNALSRFVVRVDSDDFIHEDLVKMQYLFLSMNNHMDAVSCDYFLVNDKEDILERKNGADAPIACGIMFRKDRLIDIGLYDEKFMLREEEDLRIRFLDRYNIYNIPLPLYRYRKHEGNSTNNQARMDKYADLLKSKHNP
jgi:glycosyltransferase involved in cell wall biosynthesis